MHGTSAHARAHALRARAPSVQARARSREHSYTATPCACRSTKRPQKSRTSTGSSWASGRWKLGTSRLSPRSTNRRTPLTLYAPYQLLRTECILYTDISMSIAVGAHEKRAYTGCTQAAALPLPSAAPIPISWDALDVARHAALVGMHMRRTRILTPLAIHR